LAELAANQHTVVSTAQLRALGRSDKAILRQVRQGWLHPIHRTVYAVGQPRLSLRGRWMAAVLACGPGAALSHRAAAALWDLSRAPGGPVDVTAPTRHALLGIRCHRCRPLGSDDVTVIDGIPVTGITRTIADLAAILSLERLRTTLEAAQRRGLLDFQRLGRVHGRRGARILRQALAELHDEAPWTQSELERLLLERIRAANLPEPQCNVTVDGFVVDFYWPDHQLIVEVDSYGFHRSRRSFEDDRRRDAIHTLAGRRTFRPTYERITREADAVIRDLSALLANEPKGPSGP
jgi:very-short-patch-repair endonuclease